jgi:hypothetical protein
MYLELSVKHGLPDETIATRRIYDIEKLHAQLIGDTLAALLREAAQHPEWKESTK